MKKNRNFKAALIVAAMIVTATHFVRADGKFLFADHGGADFVRVSKAVGASPLRFRLSRCKAEGDCTVIGKKDGYTLEDIRIPSFKLEERRELGKLSTAESRDLEVLNGMIHGIEQPKPHFPSWTYSHNFKGSVDQFVRVVEERLGKN